MQNKYFDLLSRQQQLESEKNALADACELVQTERDETARKLTHANNELDSMRLVVEGLGHEKDILQKELESTQRANDVSLGEAQAAIQKSRADLVQKELELSRKQQELDKKTLEVEQLARRARELETLLASQKKAVEDIRDNIRKALTGFSDSELTVSIRDGKVYVSMSDKLLFKSGSTYVEPRGVEALGKVAEVIKKNTDIQVTVEGHTDNVPLKGSGDMKDNWDLSVLRATSVVKILTAKYTVPVKRVTAAGRGEFFPVGDNKTPEGRAKNRRTEIVLTPDLAKLMKILEN